jgi:hypothetical protein
MFVQPARILRIVAQSSEVDSLIHGDRFRS